MALKTIITVLILCAIMSTTLSRKTKKGDWRKMPSENTSW
jgi:hypothetical protein